MALTTLFVCALFIALLLGALWHPIMGVLGYLAIYMFYNPNIWWGETIACHLTRPSFIAMMFLIIGCIVHRDKLEWSITRREVEFYLFLGTAWLVSLFFGVGMHEDSWIYLEKLTKVLIFTFFFLRVVNSLENYKLVIWTYIFGAIFLAWQAHLVGHFSSHGRLDDIGGIDFREANAFASFLLFAITMLGFQMLRSSLWKKIIYIIAIALTLNAVIMTQSRAVFLGILMASPFVLLRAPANHRKQIYLYALLGTILFLSLADVKFWNRMETIHSQVQLIEPGDGLMQKKITSRVDIWKASMRIFSDHPLGIGVKNFEGLVSYYDPRIKDIDAHNTYVLCYSEIGIIGILLFGIIIIEALFQLRRIRQMSQGTSHEEEITIYAVSLNTVLLIYLLGSMVTHSYLYSEMLWMLLALPICLENAAQKLLDSSDNPLKEEINKGRSAWI